MPLPECARWPARSAPGLFGCDASFYRYSCPFAFFGTLHWTLGGVHDHNLHLPLALRERFLAWQRELTAPGQRIFDGPVRARDGGFAEAVSLGDVELGAVLAPVHQGRLHQSHQAPVFAAQIRRATKGGQVLLQGIAHRNKGCQDHLGQALEVGRFQVLHVSVKHNNSIRYSCKRSVL